MIISRTRRIFVLPPRNTTSQKQSWSCPPNGWIKCNYDASCPQQNHLTAAGWLFRDSTGVFLGAGQAKGRQDLSVLESEMQNLILAMQTAWSLGFTKVVFEGDCKEISNILNHKHPHFGVFNWTRDIQDWKSRFEEIKFSWIQRDQNVLADILSKQQISNDSIFHFSKFVPQILSDALHCDYISVH
ncbi:hypothetical protein AALP_AA2G197100 [Arabis alpina]|uniref:RNase H type-1 domain-containing protein n=1 Tax=Arabis alpina TaxID=50452 RepID=A0A087HIN1_ARAAL|nr:hypothetical protein AALP_AA2G197100 [Arabis alpina]